MTNVGKSYPRIRAAAIIVEAGHLLLVRHIKDGDSYWLLPGGGVDFGEPAGEALVREVKEETGLEITLGDLVFANDSIPPDQHRHMLNLYFTATVAGGTLCCGDDSRLAAAEFVAIERLPELVFFPDIRDVLLPALKNGFPTTATYLGNRWQG
jgi:ADP-ribose pyrophosphatase YjhB (NUDIX family)